MNISIIKDKVRRNLKRLKTMHSQNGRSWLWLFFLLRKCKRRLGMGLTEVHDNEMDIRSDVFFDSFLSHKEQSRYLALLNPRKYFSLARNKYLTHCYFESVGLGNQMAKLYGYYDPAMRVGSGERCAYDLDSCVKILKGADVKQMVVKTTESSHGDNVLVVKALKYRGLDMGGGDIELILYNGKTMLLSELLAKKTPLIFEEVIEQTAQLSEFNPDSVNTVRIMTTLYPGGKSRVIATFIKIGRVGKCVDNAGSGGNVDGGIDVETGKIYDVIQFNGFRNTIKIDRHPDSQALLEGVVIDNWESIIDSANRWQESFPFIKAAGWDVAITKNGPKIIEVNDYWDRTGQIFIGRGWKKEIKDCYDAWKSVE